VAGGHANDLGHGRRYMCLTNMHRMFVSFQCFAPQGDEWEEKWGEHYAAGGEANKYADKWGKDGPNVWHERWGEDYDGRGGCTKYTDKVGKNNFQSIPLSP